MATVNKPPMEYIVLSYSIGVGSAVPGGAIASMLLMVTVLVSISVCDKTNEKQPGGGETHKTAIKLIRSPSPVRNADRHDHTYTLTQPSYERKGKHATHNRTSAERSSLR